MLNKIDLVPDGVLETRIREILERSGWQGRWFAVSAINGVGCRRLIGQGMTWLEDNLVNQAQVNELEELSL